MLLTINIFYVQISRMKADETYAQLNEEGGIRRGKKFIVSNILKLNFFSSSQKKEENDMTWGKLK